MHEHDMSFSSIPQAVKTAFEESSYSKSPWMHEGEVDVIVKNDEGLTLYVIEVEKEENGTETEADLYYSEDGVLVKEVIDADKNHQTGWEGYDLLVNAEFKNDRTSTVKTYNGESWSTAKGIAFRYEGNEMMVRVPRSYFGSGKLAFDFHWADGIQKLGDIEEFFLNGDQAPSRRANYRFEEE